MQVRHNEERQRFEIALDDGDVAFADYRRAGDRVLFPHTVVPRAHEGQGLASAIAKVSLDWARSQGLSVVPQCSFYVTYMRRHPEVRDLLDPGSMHLLER